MLRRRHRTGPYPLAQSRGTLRPMIGLAAIALASVVLLWAGKAVLSVFDFGNAIERMGVILEMENRGAASVSLVGQPPRTADASIKLYPGDAVSTDKGSPAHMTFFDGSLVRMEKGTSVEILESAHGSNRSTIRLKIERGMVWMHSPVSSAFSGSVVREVEYPQYQASIPSGTEALFTPDAVEIYDADGIGVTLTLAEASTSIIISEGQRYTIPTSIEENTDLYAQRTVLGRDTEPSAFVRAGRSLLSSSASQAHSLGATQGEELLVVTHPKEGAIVEGAALTVTGSMGPSVNAVRVNGYKAVLDRDRHSFSLEITPPNGQLYTIVVEAIDESGEVLAKTLRNVTQKISVVPKPTITLPATDRSIYATSKEEIEIRGTAPKGTAGIIVNDYRLQLFSPGDTEWSYLASESLGNFSRGENIYRIVAVSADNVRSEPAILTIRLGDEAEGIISAGASSTASLHRSSSSAINPASLPVNDPLKPGTLSVNAPTSGSRHEGILSASGAEFIIEGTAPPGTASVWVNDYQLKLFTPGKTFFNYIASTSLNTLKRGENPYVIVARDAEGKILDRLTYVIALMREGR